MNLADIKDIRAQFPILERNTPTGLPLIYLDSAATALKPQCVIDAVTDVLTNRTANIHRSVHYLGDEATELYETTREITSAFIGAEPNEIVFLRNTTEALNLVAKAFLGNGRIISSVGEHHSNYLPWQSHNIHRLSLESNGDINWLELEQELSKGDVALVSLAHASNITGYMIDLKKLVDMSHAFGAKVMIDAAQSAPHTQIDVAEIGCDFLAFSGHKLGAPSGVGVLFGKAELLEEMDYWLLGGATVESVTQHVIEAKNAPWKFEAGTPAIESVIGLQAALIFLLELGMDKVEAHFTALSDFTRICLSDNLPLVNIIGGAKMQQGPFSLTVPGISPHIITRGLSDRYGICLRSGFHCAQPLHDFYHLPASIRLSFWLYNTENEIEQAIKGIANFINVVR
ncbi:cysteine desulfurase [Thalassotalea sp. SU-HH00458]|uniref:aminotransferase class V-fold PLP-dependent enzyme n=1 Tax=Thalassotalea sp. SU-HH00458 TaxID=3127657 RepID=UPI00310AB2ED